MKDKAVLSAIYALQLLLVPLSFNTVTALSLPSSNPLKKTLPGTELGTDPCKTSLENSYLHTVYFLSSRASRSLDSTFAQPSSPQLAFIRQGRPRRAFPKPPGFMAPAVPPPTATASKHPAKNTH